MKRWLVYLLMVPAAVLCCGLLSLAWLVLRNVPPFVTVVGVVIMAIVAAWFFFGRRNSAGTVPGSETSLMGRQSSKEGLL